MLDDDDSLLLVDGRGGTMGLDGTEDEKRSELMLLRLLLETCPLPGTGEMSAVFLEQVIRNMCSPK